MVGANCRFPEFNPLRTAPRHNSLRINAERASNILRGLERTMEYVSVGKAHLIPTAVGMCRNDDVVEAPCRRPRIKAVYR